MAAPGDVSDISQPAGESAERLIARPQYNLRHTASAGCAFEPHAHAAYTVTALLRGRMSVCIGDADYEVGAGQAALTGVNQTHAGRAEGVEFVSVRLSQTLVHDLAAEAGLTRVGNAIAFRAAVTGDPAITQLARAIAGEMAGEMVGQRAMLDALVSQLAVYLLRAHLTVRRSAQIEMSRAGPVDRRLRRAIEFMHANYARDLALEEIAASAYLSEYHFARLFKRLVGLTPYGYLANLRIERARHLLAETALPISAVALTVGYQSQSHFTKIFKAITGLTPKAYRDGVK